MACARPGRRQLSAEYCPASTRADRAARLVRPAAYLGKQIIVSDIETDPLWADYKELAGPHRAPLIAASLGPAGKVMGTFAM
jgi:hypothetical protein